MGFLHSDLSLNESSATSAKSDNTELKLERAVKYQTIPFVLTGLCLMSSGEAEGSLAVDFLSWTLSKVLIFNRLPPDSL